MNILYRPYRNHARINFSHLNSSVDYFCFCLSEGGEEMNPLEEVMTAAEAAERWGKAPITVQPLFLQGVQVIWGRQP